MLLQECKHLHNDQQSTSTQQFTSCMSLPKYPVPRCVAFVPFFWLAKAYCPFISVKVTDTTEAAVSNKPIAILCFFIVSYIFTRKYVLTSKYFDKIYKNIIDNSMNMNIQFCRHFLGHRHSCVFIIMATLVIKFSDKINKNLYSVDLIRS